MAGFSSGFRPLRTAALLCAAVIAGAPAWAVPVSGNLGITVDDSGGNGVDLDLQITPTRLLKLNAGIGRSQGSEETTDVDSTMWHTGAELSGRRGGFAVEYGSFDDGANYSADTLAGRGWLNVGRVELSLLARRRELMPVLELQVLGREIRREVEITAQGFGASVRFNHDDWSAYASAMQYDYDDRFEDFIALSRTPQLRFRPRLEALVSSFVTQTYGTVDSQWSAGYERLFDMHAISLDVSGVRDAIDDSASTSVVVTYRKVQSAHVDWSAGLGLVDSEEFGQLMFLGISLGLSN